MQKNRSPWPTSGCGAGTPLFLNRVKAKRKAARRPRTVELRVLFRPCWFRDKNHKVFFRVKLQSEDALVSLKIFNLHVTPDS